ncbi:matrilin-3-like [Mytilus edulis]|uniref:matrilin-3-like n=1 Tax=Mytilus edulis TaxID=6550 RepID=UPI0039F11CEC
MLKLGVLTFFVVCFVNGQLTDKTTTPNASGSDVVEAVVNLIREACIFPNDKKYLRRLAYVESMDGLEANTYRPNYYGGIWQIDQDMFQQIATAIVLDDAKKMITQRIGIDWSKVQWIDLAKPLYSGLAAALFTLLKAGNNEIPRGIQYQANFWVNFFKPDHLANVFFTKSNKLETGCKRTNILDLVFALDSSTSLAPQEFDAAKQFVKSIVDSFEISSDKTQVGVIRFSTTIDGGFKLNTHTSADGLKKAIDGVQYKSGGTHTAEAIEYAINNLFTTTNGARLGSSKILILVTDGRSENRNETLRQAAAAKAKGISIFAIGVSAQVDERELNAVASQPTCTHVQILNSFDDLDSLKAEMEQVSCKAQTTPSITTPEALIMTSTEKPTRASLFSCKDDRRVLCSQSLCNEAPLKPYCPLTCKLCTPCFDSKMVDCKNTAVCHDTTLRNYCKATCGICSGPTATPMSTGWIPVVGKK